MYGRLPGGIGLKLCGQVFSDCIQIAFQPGNVQADRFDRLRNGTFGAWERVVPEILLNLLGFGFSGKVFGQMLDEPGEQESALETLII